MHYTRAEFVRRMSPTLLNAYFKSRNIPIKLDEQIPHDERFKEFEQKFEKLEKGSELVESEFESVFELVSEKGVSLLIERASAYGDKLPKEFDDLPVCDKVFWFFINRDKTFEDAYHKYMIDFSTGWVYLQVQPGIVATPQSEKIKKLENQVGEYYYKNQRRGSLCEADIIKREGATCIVAYPEGHTQKEMTYEGKKLKRHSVFTPVTRVYFLYKPDEGCLGIKVKGREKLRLALANIFTQLFLGHEVTKEDIITFQLNLLKQSQDMTVDIMDGLEIAHLVSVTLEHSGTMHTITIPMRSMGGNHAMIEELNHRRLDPAHFDITEAKIMFKFYQPAFKRARKHVSIVLNTRGTSTLQEIDHHNAIKKTLRKWKIDPRPLI